MESHIFTFISELIANGVITETGLIFSVIILILSISYYFIKPMYLIIKDLPTKENLNDSIDIKNEEIIESAKEMTNKLDKLIQVLDNVEDYEKDNYTKITELKRDIEHIKQILNQFQGHLMYGNRRGNDFGNRELT